MMHPDDCRRVSYKTPSCHFLIWRNVRFTTRVCGKSKAEIRVKISGIRIASIAKMYIFALAGEIP